MRAVVDTDGNITVRLSERNLIGLITKLHTEGSFRTLITNEVEGARSLVVVAEGDTEHYGMRQPGPMHPLSEEASRIVRMALWGDGPKVRLSESDIHYLCELVAERVADCYYEELSHEVKDEDYGRSAEELTEKVANEAYAYAEAFFRKGVPCRPYPGQQLTLDV